MNKKHYFVFTSMLIASSLLLSGCQVLTGYQQIDKADQAAMAVGKIYPLKGEVNLACAGTYHCEITQVDRSLVISSSSHKPISAAILAQMPNSRTQGVSNATLGNQSKATMTPLLNKNSVKVVPLSASGMKGMTNYYVRMLPAKREVSINFYPEKNIGYVERFVMIHDFNQSGTYVLRAYRKKSAQEAGSILDTASPEPLCVDLLQDNKLKRHFCKQLDANSQGEFVETRLTSTAKTK